LTIAWPIALKFQRRMVSMIVDEQRAKVQREPRRQLRKQPTWISVDDGITKLECLVLDVSPGGAKIATDTALDVGDRFGLALVPDHPKRQQCEVVWRRGKTCGIKFLP
jgi:PilZ domain